MADFDVEADLEVSPPPPPPPLVDVEPFDVDPTNDAIFEPTPDGIIDAILDPITFEPFAPLTQLWKVDAPLTDDGVEAFDAFDTPLEAPLNPIKPPSDTPLFVDDAADDDGAVDVEGAAEVEVDAPNFGANIPNKPDVAFELPPAFDFDDFDLASTTELEPFAGDLDIFIDFVLTFDTDNFFDFCFDITAIDLLTLDFIPTFFLLLFIIFELLSLLILLRFDLALLMMITFF